jgi:F-type H+-transporting ATPase subunit g
LWCCHNVITYQKFDIFTHGGLVCCSLPGRYESFWKEVDGAKLLLKNRKNLKVEDLGVAALFGIELYAWLCTGEIIGRGFTLTGYDV